MKYVLFVKWVQSIPYCVNQNADDICESSFFSYATHKRVEGGKLVIDKMYNWVGKPGSKNARRVIVLAGLPGSGKTFVAKKLQAAGWIWINQVHHELMHEINIG